MEIKIRKLVRHLDDKGVFETAGVVVDHTERSVANLLEGSPGYYRGQMLCLRRRYNTETITPVWISPKDITGLTGKYERREDGHLDYFPHFKPRESEWKSVSYAKEVEYGDSCFGSWDKDSPQFSQLLLYRGAHQHFVDDQDWKKTVYYQQLRDRFCKRGWNDEEAEELAMNRCQKLDWLHDRMSEHGYRSQRKLNGHPLHEVTVTVGRDGDVLYNCEGRHRLSISKILGVDAIPVLVLATHEKFDGSLTSIFSNTCEL
ncbi:hypothetical protein SAMN04487967_2296 [Natronorubrum sediminis]|uniref:ParB-like nuclease domain-containing protein n=1 Tax=Natronorubrum sediminis TaxID=640943 RepID=A0A1H6FYM6_9EURY|nr:hypothetical protein [Natronorubrum sediminis]SEH15897.1 hypothetical protein SAMN04487967_2296 [Natronorubrum sediminis]